jgi:ubiquinone/menaquinone biosynthesis C-methylase UbiE
VKGQRVLDIGSGTGTLAFAMARAGAYVICGDVDERFLKLIKERMEAMLDREALEKTMALKKLSSDAPNLQDGEITMAVCIDTYHHIDGRVAYFALVRQGLVPGGRLVIVDFQKKECAFGPVSDQLLRAKRNSGVCCVVTAVLASQWR